MVLEVFMERVSVWTARKNHLQLSLRAGVLKVCDNLVFDNQGF